MEYFSQILIGLKKNKDKLFISCKLNFFGLPYLWSITICSSKTTNHNDKLESNILKREKKITKNCPLLFHLS